MERHWIAQCPECKWIGKSTDCGGGGPLADTGDYNDIVCPVCLKEDKWVEVGEAKGD